MTELQPILEFLAGHCPWLPTAVKGLGAVMVLCRLFLKPFSQKWREARTAQWLEVFENGTPAEAAAILARLNSPRYRAAVFWVDLLFSFKLPTRIEFKRLQADRLLGIPIPPGAAPASAQPHPNPPTQP